MSRITIIGDKEVTNPVAKAAISIAVVPLTLMFVAAVLVGTFALVGVVLALTFGVVGVLLIGLAVFIPVIVVLAVIAKVVSWPFERFGRRDEEGLSTGISMTLGGPNVQRIAGVLVLLVGVALIVVSQGGQPLGIAIGVVLMAVGFWLSYVRNEVAKIRRGRNERS